ncbi:hypothetical protein HHK36_033184 [Tetracentron sinense]|uniref:Kinesin-like protein n=1 Tax=Tetracentron sinense TaxID=13715 RepID=A0A834Y7Y0_TETSI|nr:hypothetical protein HHK36_033184 [Tetracentron sinense]
MEAIGGEELMHWENTQEPGTHEEKILVSVRLRPLNAKDIARNDVSDWECINDNTIIFRNNLPERSMFPTAYTFDRVFRCDCSTKQVYEEGAREVALSVVSGINSSIFAYGQTSSGKTYTMSGITEHTVVDIYDYIQRHEERAFVLKFSAMEIYNEAVRDLLSSDSTPLRLLDDPERGTIVEKLTEEILRDWSHLQELLSICEAQRQIGETSLNETSSRSHQILRLTIESSASEFLGKDNSSTLAASVNFVDLAGSERASQALSAGARLKEGCHINRSLLTLGTVIRKLSYSGMETTMLSVNYAYNAMIGCSKGRTGHVPYRDSKLTRILQSSLGGNSRTAIICTMSLARSHVEQSRNTLLFASCAKEVNTNAQVNIVMSDKTLVKHLQRELDRLESELRSPGATSVTCDSAALLREKDLQIEKMEKEIKELTHQRDLAQCRVEDLLRVVGDDQASRRWTGLGDYPKLQVRDAWEDEYTISELSVAADPHYLDVGVRTLNTSQHSDRLSGSNSNEHCLQLPENSEDHFPSDGIYPRLSIGSSQFVGPDPCQGWEENSQGNGEDFEDQCREVRCIEIEESGTNRNVESKSLLFKENEGILASVVARNEKAGDQVLESSLLKGERELSPIHANFTYGALEQKIQDVQKTIDCLVNPYPDEPSSRPPAADISSSRSLKLIRSRSCRATVMTSSSSSRSEKAEQNENTPPNGNEKDFLGRPEGFQRKLSALNYVADIGKLQRKDSQASVVDASIDEMKAQKIMTSADEEITSISSFVAGLKEMAKHQYEKQLADGSETEPKAIESGKNVKDVGLDPMQDALDSPSNWSLEFERQQREIVELWHTCNVSLIHRTYFFLLFKGDPADSIYMEVELRRLSFLKGTFSQGNQAVEDGGVLTPASSLRALHRERELLSKQMQKRYSEEERDCLYQKWGIELGTKQRRLQLAHRLWTDAKDMDHIVESASIVAKLVGFLEPGQALKEMFGLTFKPQRTSRRSFSWKK